MSPKKRKRIYLVIGDLVCTLLSYCELSSLARLVEIWKRFPCMSGGVTAPYIDIVVLGK